MWWSLFVSFQNIHCNFYRNMKFSPVVPRIYTILRIIRIVNAYLHKHRLQRESWTSMRFQIAWIYCRYRNLYTSLQHTHFKNKSNQRPTHTFSLDIKFTSLFSYSLRYLWSLKYKPATNWHIIFGCKIHSSFRNTPHAKSLYNLRAENLKIYEANKEDSEHCWVPYNSTHGSTWAGQAIMLFVQPCYHNTP